ncbi:bacterial surface protein [Lachnospiraceae bacterium KM106-2]|nr:bacterial surface protein [Lachnospiraceae bacterium KM106-2]
MKKLQGKKIAVLFTILFALSTFLFTGNTADAATIKLSKSNVRFVEGKTTTLKIRGTSKKVSWSSTNNKIVKVNSKGKLTAVKVGSATIRAKVSGVTRTCKVTVVPKFNSNSYKNSLKSSLVGRYIDVMINDNNQSFKLAASDITSYKITKSTMNSNLTQVKVYVTLVTDRTVAKVKTNATCTYTIKSNKWKLTSVTMNSKLNSINLRGSWVGKYKASQGDTGLRLDIDNVTSDGYATATFNFYALPTTPMIPDGSFAVKGGYDLSTGKVVFAEVDWIVQPEGYSMIGLNGYVNVANRSISGRTDHWNYYTFEVFLANR